MTKRKTVRFLDSSQESCSISGKDVGGGALMTFSALPKGVWIEQLTHLPCLVVYVTVRLFLLYGLVSLLW